MCYYLIPHGEGEGQCGAVKVVKPTSPVDVLLMFIKITCKLWGSRGAVVHPFAIFDMLRVMSMLMPRGPGHLFLVVVGLLSPGALI